MRHCRSGIGSVLALIVLVIFSVGARAQASIQLTLSFDQGWVTGTMTGMPPWPFNFTLEGSFAQGSTAVLTFDSSGTPALLVTPTVDPAHLPATQWYGLSFSAGASVASAVGSPTSHATYEVPVLKTLDSTGHVLASAPANGFILSGTGSPANNTSNVPEPATAALMLCGLAGVAALAGRRRPEGRSCT